MNKYKQFKSLHSDEDILFLGNTHDVVSAMSLESAGFKAIGTTSWGIANTFGHTDGEHISFSDYIFIIKKIISNVSIPVSVDVESGFSSNTKDIIKHVLMVADCGSVGINIEDSQKNSEKLRSKDENCELLSNLRIELDKNGFKDFFINARTDVYLKKIPHPLNETILRGQAYAEHGADGLFVPGLVDDNDIKIITEKLQLPLNVMSLPQLTDLRKLKQLKVKRFSFGNAFSDLMISTAENTAKKLVVYSNTETLYQHAPVELEFKN